MSVETLHLAASYRIEREGTFVRHVVWSCPDLSWEEGAELASLASSQLVALAATSQSLVLDLRHAPAVSGPKTLQAVERVLDAWASLRCRIAIIVADLAIQRLQMKRLADGHSHFVCVVGSEREARPWLEGQRRAEAS